MGRRHCATCRRETPHWCEQGVLPSPEGWQAPLVQLARVIRSSFVWRWHCLECAHPWSGTLIRPGPTTDHPAPPPASP